MLGALGVGLLWPAILRRGTYGQEGEEIDRDRFTSAADVEALVGVVEQEGCEVWRFWTRLE